MAGKKKANGEGTIYQRIDGRWEAAGYVQAADGTRKRVRVYGATRKEAADKLTLKLADSQRGLVVAKDSTTTVAEYLTEWLTGVARHRLRATTYATYQGLVNRFLIPGIGTRTLGTLTCSGMLSVTRCGCVAVRGNPLPGSSPRIWKIT